MAALAAIRGWCWAITAARRGRLCPHSSAAHRYFSRELAKPAPRPQFKAVNELAWAAMTREVLAAEPRRSTSRFPVFLTNPGPFRPA